MRRQNISQNRTEKNIVNALELFGKRSHYLVTREILRQWLEGLQKGHKTGFR